jgi:MSHA biogenesis protein MshK
MVEPLKRRAGWLSLAAFPALLALALCAGAENLADPTLPPASLGQPESSHSAPVASGPVLQSVLVSAGRKVAVISGQTVTLGGKFGDAVVVKITEGEVALRTGNDVKILKLFPGMEKRASAAGVGALDRQQR